VISHPPFAHTNGNRFPKGESALPQREKKRRQAEPEPHHRIVERLQELELFDFDSEGDPQGSYTGVPLLGKMPVQDADDL